LWELAFLLRRFSFCFCLVFLRFYPSAQTVRVGPSSPHPLAGLTQHPISPDEVERGFAFAQIVAVCCIVLATLVQFLHKPFWDTRLDYLDCVCCTSIMLHVLSSAYFNNRRFYDEMDHDAPRLFEAGLIGVNCLSLLAISCLFVTSLVKHEFTAYAVARMVRTVARSVATLQHELLRERDSFVAAIRQALAETPSLCAGVRISHVAHGLGEIKDMVRNEDGEQCWDVVFDSGERRYYPRDQASKKVAAVVEDMSSQPKVMLRVFRLGVLQCLPCASPCVIEALYVLLLVIENGGESLQLPTDMGVSIGVVTSSSPLLHWSSTGAVGASAVAGL
jgi:hypothetical protein